MVGLGRDDGNHLWLCYDRLCVLEVYKVTMFGGRKLGLTMVPGPMWSSNLTIKVRALLPWKHAQTPLPPQVPLPL